MNVFLRRVACMMSEARPEEDEVMVVVVVERTLEVYRGGGGGGGGGRRTSIWVGKQRFRGNLSAYISRVQLLSTLMSLISSVCQVGPSPACSLPSTGTTRTISGTATSHGFHRTVTRDDSDMSSD